MSMLARFGGGGGPQRDPKLAAILVSDIVDYSRLA
jgi:hypothetical protein